MSKFEIVSLKVLEANEDKTGYIIDVFYKASLIHAGAHTVEVPSEKIYRGEVSVYYDPETKWYVYQLALPNNSDM